MRACKQTNKQNLNGTKTAIRKMQNDLSLIYALFSSLSFVLFVLHHIVVTFKTVNQNAYNHISWRVAVYFHVRLEKRTYANQYEYRMRIGKTRKPSSNFFWCAHQLTSDSMIAFAMQCHAVQKLTDVFYFKRFFFSQSNQNRTVKKASILLFC